MKTRTIESSKMSVEQVKVEVLGKTYTIATPIHEKESLLKAVELLNQKIQLIKSTGVNMENEKVSIMAALNITHDLLKVTLKQEQPVAESSGLDENSQKKIEEMITLCNETLKI